MTTNSFPSAARRYGVPRGLEPALFEATQPALGPRFLSGPLAFTCPRAEGGAQKAIDQLSMEPGRDAPQTLSFHVPFMGREDRLTG